MHRSRVSYDSAESWRCHCGQDPDPKTLRAAIVAAAEDTARLRRLPTAFGPGKRGRCPLQSRLRGCPDGDARHVRDLELHEVPARIQIRGLEQLIVRTCRSEACSAGWLWQWRRASRALSDAPTAGAWVSRTPLSCLSPGRAKSACRSAARKRAPVTKATRRSPSGRPIA